MSLGGCESSRTKGSRRESLTARKAWTQMGVVCAITPSTGQTAPNQPEVGDQCLQNILKIKPECDRLGMPLMVEPLVFQPNKDAGGYMVDGDLKKILPLVRQAVELGADIIKADPTDDVSVYHQVVEISGRIPVLVRGGGRAPDAEILQRTEALIKQGAAGIVYGRNVIQHANPAGMTKALMAIVHDGADAAAAAQFLKPGSL